MLFQTFNPSARKTLFFQKKIKQLNVQFIEAIVAAQYATMVELSKLNVLFVDFIPAPKYTTTGMHNVT
jgi:hypothetical protein